jgi:hypothetical protein
MVQNEIMAVECLGCGEEIHPKRLEILPNTKYCVNCSDVSRKRGVTVQRGKGDHSYTDVVIMEEKQFIDYMLKDKPKKGASKAEYQNFDDDENTPNTSGLDVIDIG